MPVRSAVRRLITDARERNLCAFPDPPTPAVTPIQISNLKITRSAERATPSAIGTMSELSAAVDLMNRGFDVYRALCPNAKCDLVAVRGDLMLRIEVKCTKVRDSRVVGRSPNKKSTVDHVALVLRDGSVFYRPELPIEGAAQ